jgi:hypothetical protein
MIMMQRFAIATLAAVILCAAPVLAQCQKTCNKAQTCQSKDKGKACCQGKTTCPAMQAAGAEQAKSAMCSSDVTCDGDVVRFKGVELPRIGFKVGDQLTCCMKAAKEMVEGDTAKVKFVVADKTYDDLGEAKAARLKVLEQYYEDLLKVKYGVGDKCVGCPVAAAGMAKECGQPVHYRLAAFDFAEKDEADKAAKAARAAGDKVAMSWAVGEKKFCCPTGAAQAAKTAGRKVEYCVGEQKTGCEVTAKTRLIESRITAAIEVLAKAAQG